MRVASAGGPSSLASPVVESSRVMGSDRRASASARNSAKIWAVASRGRASSRDNEGARGASRAARAAITSASTASAMARWTSCVASSSPGCGAGPGTSGTPEVMKRRKAWRVSSERSASATSSIGPRPRPVSLDTSTWPRSTHSSREAGCTTTTSTEVPTGLSTGVSIRTRIEPSSVR